MPGPGMSNSNVGQLLGVFAAIVGVIGFVFLGWRFGDTGGTVPESIGLGVTAVAVVLVLYRRFGPSQ